MLSDTLLNIFSVLSTFVYLSLFFVPWVLFSYLKIISEQWSYFWDRGERERFGIRFCCNNLEAFGQLIETTHGFNLRLNHNVRYFLSNSLANVFVIFVINFYSQQRSYNSTSI